jgi:medium-chain acyl-[acyl-carrier-protein] hydrolase
MAETPFTRLDSLVQNLGESLLPLLDRPFACFGHSLGGLLTFELARWLRYHRQPEPRHLWISAARAPQLPITDPPIHALPEAELVAELRRYNGTPAAVLENAELMELLLPTIRADFTLLETYRYQLQTPLTCSITALAGSQDLIVRSEEIAPWQVHTVGAFSLNVVSGGHFFVHQPQILQFLEAFFLGNAG